MKKAYLVQYGEQPFDDVRCVIVFAESNGKAKAIGAKELDADFIDITHCKRAPDFDKFAESGKLTDRDYIENRFAVGCPKCERPCDEYSAVYDESGQWLKTCTECELEAVE